MHREGQGTGTNRVTRSQNPMNIFLPPQGPPSLEVSPAPGGPRLCCSACGLGTNAISVTWSPAETQAVPVSLAAVTDFHELKAAHKCHRAVLWSESDVGTAVLLLEAPGTSTWSPSPAAQGPHSPAHGPSTVLTAHRSALRVCPPRPSVRTWGSPEPQPRTISASTISWSAASDFTLAV